MHTVMWSFYSACVVVQPCYATVFHHYSRPTGVKSQYLCELFDTIWVLSPLLFFRSHWYTFFPHLVAMSTAFFPLYWFLSYSLSNYSQTRLQAPASQPVERFMQIERSRPFDESFSPARKFEVVDAWLQDKVITLWLVCTACAHIHTSNGHISPHFSGIRQSIYP